MKLGPLPGVRILGGGCAFPSLSLDNSEVLADLPRFQDPQRRAFVAEGMASHDGFSRRHWAHRVGDTLPPAARPHSGDLAAQAARAALEDAQRDPSEVGLVICTTSSPHSMTATTSAHVTAALGAQVMGQDLRAGCAGSLFGLATASLYCATQDSPVLLIGTEVFSRLCPPSHPLSRLSMGDGAAALLLERDDEGALEAFYGQTDGSLSGLVRTQGHLPPTPTELESGAYQFSGDPEGLAERLVPLYTEALHAVMAQAGITGAQIDLFIPHQTSAGLIATVAEATGIPAERAICQVARHANIGTAGWIAALVQARAEGRLQGVERLALAAVGGGMNWAAALLRLSP